MAKQFTDAPKRPPLQGAKFGIPSPILASYSKTPNTTMGQVVSFTNMPANQLDRCEVYFRGEIVGATCCHPGIEDGMNVNMIEQPIGVWWATVIQKSWYSRPLTELVEKGHNYQAAVEYLLSFGAKWRPRLIIIDKRGQSPVVPVEPTPEPEPVIKYTPLTFNPDSVVGYFPQSWPYDPALFAEADTNGDGFVDAAELAFFLSKGVPPVIIVLTTESDDGLPLYTAEFIGSGSVVRILYPARIKHSGTPYDYFATQDPYFYGDTPEGLFGGYISFSMLKNTDIWVIYERAFLDRYPGTPPSFKL